MSSNVLFVFEGVRTEQRIVDNLEQFFIQDSGKTIVRASYGHNIYQLYQALEQDEGLDLFELVRETLGKRQKLTQQDSVILDMQDTDSITDIYLFFDYDPHTTSACDEKLAAMLALFNDAMDKGLLCVSYPMVEAIRHMQSHEPAPLLHPMTDLKHYKTFLSEKNTDNHLIHVDDKYFNWGTYDLATWTDIIDVNLCRANYLTNDKLTLPNEPIVPQAIFNAQLEKHIPSQTIAVLSAFPLMLHEYYGQKLWAKLVT